MKTTKADASVTSNVATALHTGIKLLQQCVNITATFYVTAYEHSSALLTAGKSVIFAADGTSFASVFA